MSWTGNKTGVEITIVLPFAYSVSYGIFGKTKRRKRPFRKRKSPGESQRTWRNSAMRLSKNKSLPTFLFFFFFLRYWAKHYQNSSFIFILLFTYFPDFSAFFFREEERGKFHKFFISRKIRISSSNLNLLGKQSLGFIRKVHRNRFWFPKMLEMSYFLICLLLIRLSVVIENYGVWCSGG